MNGGGGTARNGKPGPLTHLLLTLTQLAIGDRNKGRESFKQAAPAKDAPWEAQYLHRLLRPEVEAALTKAGL